MDKLKHEHVYKCTLCNDEITQEELEADIKDLHVEIMKLYNKSQSKLTLVTKIFAFIISALIAIILVLIKFWVIQ